MNFVPNCVKTFLKARMQKALWFVKVVDDDIEAVQSGETVKLAHIQLRRICDKDDEWVSALIGPVDDIRDKLPPQQKE